MLAHKLYLSAFVVMNIYEWWKKVKQKVENEEDNFHFKYETNTCLVNVNFRNSIYDLFKTHFL